LVYIIAEKVITVRCPFCNSENVTKNGHNKTGKQVYNCKNPEYGHHNFVNGLYKAYERKVRRQVLKMAVDCIGTHAIGRILGILKDTITAILKKMKIGSGR